MRLSSFIVRNLATGALVVAGVATAALANDRGPLQAIIAPSDQTAPGSVSDVDVSLAGIARLSPADRYGRHLYIVRFAGISLARYKDGIRGLAGTSARVTGQRLDTSRPEAVAYRDFLAARHDEYLNQMGQFVERSVEPKWQYLNVLNGVAIRLTPAEADRVAGLPFVAGIEIDRFDELHTDNGSDLIGAPEIWDGLTTSGVGNKGEGVVIGILDTGFNHSHPSFTEVASDGYEHVNPYGDGVFTGVCEDPSDAEYEDLCNNKVIGAYSIASDSTTAEDTNGHGSHVGATAGGNPVEANVFGLAVDVIGVAPRANLINYKVCQPLCSAASRIAAINFAIDDGVHVLNHSIGNNEPPWASSVSLAFLDANAAGIFVAASAGNCGPGASTAASTGPWNMAVGASTHRRIFAQEVDLAGLAPVAGVPGSGPVLTNAFTTDLRWAGDVDTNNVEGCDAFAADSFDGEGALISGGTCTFATKVDNAVAAGADLVIIYNNAAGPPTVMGGLEGTTVSSFMISITDGADFIAEISGGTASVSIDPVIERFTDEGFGDVMARFSSRGPASHNTIAPAITAPGVSILAASTAANDNWSIIGGTSMSSPHVAGTAALLAAQHPNWTPTEIRSALTLTAIPETLREDGLTPSDAFDQGSGRMQAGEAGRVGFVMDETIANFVAANPADGGNPATLNMSSIKEANCAIECSFERTIRSEVSSPVDYTVTTTVPAGVSITVTPASFTLGAGDTQALEIDIDVTGTSFDEWLFAAIQIEEGSTNVEVSNARMPVALVSREPQPIIEVSPASLVSSQATDSVASRQFAITNPGQLPLEWQLNEQGPQSVPGPQVSTVIWDNPLTGISGRINNFSNPDDTGIYQSDAFAILAPSSVETIFSAGFTLGTPDVTELTWMVFEDNNGEPAGDPESSPEAAIWSFSAAPNATGVSFANADMSLDLAAAGAPPLDLEPGVYWIMAFPDVEVFSLGPNNLYAWYHGESGTGRQISPGGLLGFPTNWVGAPEGRAFTLTGTIDCSAEFTPWTNVSPTSGTIEPNEQQAVNVDFYAIGMMEGSYRSAFCVLSNDPDRPVVLMPVQLNVMDAIFSDRFEDQ